MTAPHPPAADADRHTVAATRSPVTDADAPVFEVRIASDAIVAKYKQRNTFGAQRWFLVLADDTGAYLSTLAHGHGELPGAVLAQALRTADRLYSVGSTVAAASEVSADR
ncbi:hypothetical protein GCM10009613_55080 [Pseudonocardia kongjuensis]|uniref:DUF1508 domain-containing protein n=1 Tax=Pseudonocardia kongjuensis TaxID=102227 RepID=A0ABN1Y6Q9_9PSEU